MRSGFIIPILFLIILSSSAYYLYIRYAKSPTKLTYGTAEALYKYPNNTNWQLKESHNICLMPQNPCNQPVVVTFTSNNTWPAVYNFYKSYLSETGWTTNSTIYTSIPSSIVFKQNSCTLTLE